MMSIKTIYNRYHFFKIVGLKKPLRAALDKEFCQSNLVFHWEQ